MPTDSHAHEPDPTGCPWWCVGRTGQPHDVDDTYGVHGVHHDGPIAVVELAGDDGSRIYVKPSRFVPTGGQPWPARVEVELDLADTRHWSGDHSVWLSTTDADAVTRALTVASIRADGVNHADAHRRRQR